MGRPDECLGCGLCVTVCPVERVGGRTILSSLADPTAEMGNPWLCTSCWRCQEACPVGVDIHGLMMALRREQPAPEGYRRAFENVLSCGYALPLDAAVHELRAAHGLEAVEMVRAEWVRMLVKRET